MPTPAFSPLWRSGCRSVVTALLLASVWAGLLAQPSFLFAQADSVPANQELIAVLDLQGVGASKVEATALTERLREVLLKTGHFVLVDRSQMDAILDEQALQQSGCTSQECVVQVGQILGVRKIVSGKAVKVDSELWLLSVLMVDVETARTLTVESLRHEGSLFELLDRRMPELGDKLAGLEPAPQAAVAKMAPAVPSSAARIAPPRQSAVAAPLRVALLPAQFYYTSWDVLRPNNHLAVRAVEAALKAHGDRFVLSYSAYEAKDAVEAQDRYKRSELAGLRADRVWRSGFTLEPNDEALSSAGKRIGFDLAMLYSLSTDMSKFKYTVYVVDVTNGRRFEASGETADAGSFAVAGIPKIEAGVNRVLGEYLASRR